MGRKIPLVTTRCPKCGAFVLTPWKQLLAGLVIVAVLVGFPFFAKYMRLPGWWFPAYLAYAAVVVLPAWAHLTVYFWKVRIMVKEFGVAAEPPPDEDAMREDTENANALRRSTGE